MSGVEAPIITGTAMLIAAGMPKAIEAIQEVLKKWKGRKNDVRIMEDQLRYIQGTIKATRKIMRRVDDCQLDLLQPWATNLRCLAYDMEDLIAGHRAKTMTSSELEGKISLLNGSLNSFKACQELIKIPIEASHPTAGASSSSSTTSRAPTTFSSQHRNKHGEVFPLADLVGKEEHIRELLDLVQRPDTRFDRVLKAMVISVVGFGGIGETKLCRRVFEDVRNHGRFSLHSFVSVSDNDGKKVLDAIIRDLRGQKDAQDSNGGNTSASRQNSHRGHQTSRGGRVRGRGWGRGRVQGQGQGQCQGRNHQVQQYNSLLAQLLENERYFIVIDGVQSEELVKFITPVFPENNMGSRIIMGMNVDVENAERCDGHMSKMRPLQDEESVTRFLNKADQRPIIDFQDEDGSKSFLQKVCDGVPLALVSVYEVRKGSVDAVEDACKKLRRAKEEKRWSHRMPEVLEHSYECLHITGDPNYQNQYIPYLQACLLYFAMFRHGNVKRGSLIRRWQAEGLQFGGKAVDNLQTLIDRNFVRPLHVSMNKDQHAKTCQPPGVVLDYISKMSETEHFIFNSCRIGEPGASDDIRRLFLHPPDPEETGSQGPLVITNRNVPRRLWTLSVSWDDQQASSIVECEQLRVLDLESYTGLEAAELEKICQKLKLLKYLSFGPNITQVPSSITNLKCLETLELRVVEGNAAVLVPVEVIWMPCLKHLIGKFELMDSVHKIPYRFFPGRIQKQIKKSNLERLSGFVTRKGQGFPPLICYMGQLRKVKIWFYSDADAECLKTFLPEAITKFLKRDNIARSLSLDFQDCPQPDNLLDSIAKARGELYSLKLLGKNLSKIHLFVTNLTGITKLCLSWKDITLDATFLAELSKLNQLKYLKLDAEEIKGAYGEHARAGDNQEKIVIKTSYVKELERMCLVFKGMLPNIEIEPTALQNLVSLHLLSDTQYCPSHNLISKANSQSTAPLTKLKEVALNDTVTEETRDNWHKAASDHPSRPQILFIKHPQREG